MIHCGHSTRDDLFTNCATSGSQSEAVGKSAGPRESDRDFSAWRTEGKRIILVPVVRRKILSVSTLLCMGQMKYKNNDTRLEPFPLFLNDRRHHAHYLLPGAIVLLRFFQFVPQMLLLSPCKLSVPPTPIAYISSASLH